MRTIRASEIGSFLYCQRAWWYRKNGVETTNIRELHTGTGIHQQHGRSVLAVGCFRAIAMLFLLAGIVMLVVHFASQAL